MRWGTSCTNGGSFCPFCTTRTKSPCGSSPRSRWTSRWSGRGSTTPSRSPGTRTSPGGTTRRAGRGAGGKGEMGRDDPGPAEDPRGHLHDPEQPGGGGARRDAGGHHHPADRARDRHGAAPALTATVLSGTIPTDPLGGKTMKIRTIDQLDLSGKRTLIRVDFNIPLDKAGNITDDTRIKAVP